MNEKGNKKKERFSFIQEITEKSKIGLKDTFRSLFTSVENAFNFLYKSDTKNSYQCDDEIVLEEDFSSDQIEVLEVNFDDVEEKHEEIIQQEEIEKAHNNETHPLLENILLLTNSIGVIDKHLIELENSMEYTKDTRQILLQIKEDISKLKGDYNEKISGNHEWLDNIADIDIYNLRNHPKAINKLLHRCNILLSKVKKQNNSQNQFRELGIIIEEYLTSQKIEIKELKEQFHQAQINDKRSVLVEQIHKFLDKTIDIGLNVSLPSFYKNKVDGMLVGLVIINNRIRNIRKIIRKENKDIDYIIYDNIKEIIKNEISCIYKTKEILDDTLYQLDNLKQEFIMEFYYDMERYSVSEDIMTEFSSIAYQIASKQSELDFLLKKIEDKDLDTDLESITMP